MTSETYVSTVDNQAIDDVNGAETQPQRSPPDEPQRSGSEQQRPSINPFEVLPAGQPEAAPEVDPQDLPEEPTFGEKVDAAIESNWMIGPDEVEGFGPDEIDPNFEWTPELTTEVTEGIPEDLWDEFDGALSANHAREIREDILGDLKNQETLGNDLSALGYNLGAAILDPGAIAVTVGTAGIGAEAVAAQKLSKISRLVRMATINTSVDMAIESAVIANDSTQGWDQLLYAGIGSAALNSAIAGYALRGTRRGEINEALGNLLDEKVVNAPEYEPIAGHAGAARASVYEPISENAEDLVNELKDAPRTAFGKARVDVVGQLKSDDHPIVRELGARLGEDSLGNADDSVNRFGATEYQTHTFRSYDIETQRTITPAYREWAEEQGVGALGTRFFRKRDDFMKQVYDYVANEGTESAVGREWHPSVAKAGDAYRSAYARYLAEAKRLGIKGFEDVEVNPNYMPRLFDHERIAKLNRVYGTAEVEKLIAGAFRSVNREAAEGVAEKFAKGYIRKIREVGANVDMGVTRGLSGEDTEALREMLKDSIDIDPADIDALVDSLKISQKGGHTRSKRRALFDDGYVATLKRTDSTGEDSVKITDLFKDNAEEVFNLYNRQLSGAVALARSGFKSTSEVETMMKKIRASVDDVPGYSHDKATKAIDKIEYLVNAVTGRPQVTRAGVAEAETGWGTTLRHLRDFNFLRVMGNLGLAQIPEFGVLIGELGFRNVIKAAPALKGMLRDMKTGKLNNELLDEFEGLIGTGADYLTSTVYNRVGTRGLEGDQGLEAAVQSTVSKADKAFSHGKRIMGMASFATPINTVLYRLTSASIATAWSEAAQKGTKAFSKRRLAWMGVSDEMHDRIIAQIKQHGSFAESMLGSNKKLRRLNVDRWDDQDAAEVFVMASHRQSRNVVQENDPGSMPVWATRSEIAKTILQFRSFVLGAYSKRTLHGLRMADKKSVVTLLTTTLIAGMVAAFRAYTLSQGMSEDRREDYLEKRLSPDALAKAAFSNSGSSSVVPMMTDLLMNIAGEEGVFTHTRGSGLASGVLGNPTYDLVDTLPSMVRGVVNNETEAATRRGLSLIPFQNVIGMQQALNALADELGE